MLVDEEMDEVYTFKTPYRTYEGKEVHQRIARKNDRYFQIIYYGHIPRWDPAHHPHWCKEIIDLSRRIKEDADGNDKAFS